MLTTNRSPLDHLVSGGISSLISGAGIKQAASAGVLGYAAISASNAVANKDYSRAVLAAAAGWGANKLIGELMNPYLNNCPNCGWKNQNQKAPNNWAQQPAQPNHWANSQMQNNGSFLSSPMIKGMLVGAAVAYLLSNKEAKESLIKGVAKLQNFASAAIEEIKEQIEDAKASMQD